MADFCQQCSCFHFGEDFRELAGLKKDPNDDLYPVVLCEGCGVTQVDNDGKCIVDDCLVNHKTQKSQSDTTESDNS